MTLSTLKKYWIVVFSNGNVAHWSIASTKRRCIENYLYGTGGSDWKKDRRRGHQCIRVNITFQPVSKPPQKLNPSDTTDWYANPGNSGKVDF